jgi:DNA repair exonuclease SbcCD ATPase subunit
MNMELLASLNSGVSAPAAMTQSTQAISGYVSWIESQVSSQAGDQSAAVDQVKNHASGWYNAIYPQYLDMPAFVTSKSTEINNDLNLLIALAAQYPSAGSSLNSQIEKSASDLTQTVTAISQQATSLGQAIQTFCQNLTGDQHVIVTANNQIQDELGDANSQLSQQYGELHHLQSATCPSKSAIEGCESLIQQIQQKITQLQQAVGLLQSIASQIGNIINAAAYLGSYWTTVGSDAGTCLQSLGLLSTNPAIIGQVDLSGAQQRWNNLVQQFQLTAQQLSAA